MFRSEQVMKNRCCLLEIVFGILSKVLDLFQTRFFLVLANLKRYRKAQWLYPRLQRTLEACHALKFVDHLCHMQKWRPLYTSNTCPKLEWIHAIWISLTWLIWFKLCQTCSQKQTADECMMFAITSVLHGSSGITPTWSPLKGCWPPRFTGFRCLILRLSTVHINKLKRSF